MRNEYDKVINYKGYIGKYGIFDEGVKYFGKIENVENTLILFEGDTYDEMLTDFKNAVEDYIKISYIGAAIKMG